MVSSETVLKTNKKSKGFPFLVLPGSLLREMVTVINIVY